MIWSHSVLDNGNLTKDYVLLQEIVDASIPPVAASTYRELYFMSRCFPNLCSNHLSANRHTTLWVIIESYPAQQIGTSFTSASRRRVTQKISHTPRHPTASSHPISSAPRLFPHASPHHSRLLWPASPREEWQGTLLPPCPHARNHGRCRLCARRSAGVRLFVVLSCSNALNATTSALLELFSLRFLQIWCSIYRGRWSGDRRSGRRFGGQQVANCLQPFRGEERETEGPKGGVGSMASMATLRCLLKNNQ
jgi:hypothetical protein